MSKTQITAEPGIPQIIITREFDAPRDLVFRAHTEPELLVQWLGPRDLAMTIDRYEARDGGTWRYVHTDAEGNAYGFHGVFHGDPSPEAIVQTFEFEGVPGHVMPAHHDAGRARRHDAGAHRLGLPVRRGPRRHGRLRHGTGVRDSGERLDELLARLQAS